MEKGKVVLSQKILQREKADERIGHHKDKQKLNGLVVDRDRIFDKIISSPGNFPDRMAFDQPESRDGRNEIQRPLDQRTAENYEDQKHDFGSRKYDAELDKAKAYQKKRQGNMRPISIHKSAGTQIEKGIGWLGDDRIKFSRPDLSGEVVAGAV